MALVILVLCFNAYAMFPDQSKQFVKDAVNYALTDQESTMDYSKYVSKVDRSLDEQSEIQECLKRHFLSK